MLSTSTWVNPLLTDTLEIVNFHFSFILVTLVQKCLLHSVSETLGALPMITVVLCDPGGDPLEQTVLGSEYNKALLLSHRPGS